MAFYRSSIDRLPIKSISRHVIVLDLDETLVHSSENMDDFKRLNIVNDPKLADLRARSYIMTLDDVVGKKGTGTKTQLWGVTRPHLEEFLVFCFSYFKVVAVWSAGQTKYVEAIVDIIFRDIAMPHIVFTYPDCVPTSEGGLEKPLTRILTKIQGIDKYMSLGNTLALDDRKSTFKSNPKNGIMIPIYSPKPEIEELRRDDTALLELKTWLMTPEVVNVRDVRNLDKNKIFGRSLAGPVLASDNNNSIISRLLFETKVLPNSSQPQKVQRSPYLPKGCFQTDRGIVCDPSLKPRNISFSETALGGDLGYGTLLTMNDPLMTNDLIDIRPVSVRV